MRIIVTGGAGFLGSHLVDKFKKEGHMVIVIDNLIGGYKENVPLDVLFFKQDTANFVEMFPIIKTFQPDVIYHCACTAYEGLSVFSPNLITYNTFQNTAGILSAAIACGVKRFVYCSSMARYGKQEPPFTENLEPKPEDPYALAKVASEKLIQMLSETHNIEYVIAVPHNIIGTRQKYDDPFRNVASIFINRMLQGKQPIIYGDGTQTRSFSFVQDCVDVLAKMVGCKSGEVYNIGPDNKDGTLVTIFELAEIIAKQLKFKLKPIFLPDRPREVKHAYCSSDKIRKEFGYKCNISLEDGIAEMIADIKSKGTRTFIRHLPLEIINSKTPKTWTGEIKM